jgi:DNA-binding winged helix-turn-helix (wHTH) protein/tetratricopeptide (TPR) repeat protein
MPERSLLLKGFCLSEWLVTPEDGSLRSPTIATRLEPLLMEVLLLLCSMEGSVVSKQDLLDNVWRGRFVSDETVKGSLHHLRRILGDNPRRPRFIETLPKRGYRILVHPVPLGPEPQVGDSKTVAQGLTRKGHAVLAGQPNAAALVQATVYFERATKVDPQNPEAFAGLARTYILLVSIGAGRGGDFLPKARAAAFRAAELNPKSGESHLALAVVHFVLDYDFVSAEKQFREAVKLTPEDSLTHRWYARFLSSQARHEAAIAEARRAIEADPLLLVARRDLAMILAIAGRFDEALAETFQISDIAPDTPEMHFGLTLFYRLANLDSKAFEAFTTYLTLLGVAPKVMEGAKRAYRRGGIPAVFSFWADVLEREARPEPRNQWHLLVLYSLLGKKARCFRLMEVAYKERNPSLLFLPVSPIFASLRSDRRYSRFLKRLGF